jgi:hypothetical protein
MKSIFIGIAGRIKQGLDPKKVTDPQELVEWPVKERFTKLQLRYGNLETEKEFRRGFEWDRVIDWAEKSWGVRGELTKTLRNGEDWSYQKEIPQNSTIDFVPRWHLEKPRENGTQIFVELLGRTRVWNLEEGH